MMTKAMVSGLAVVVLLSAAASADTVKLRNGRSIEGIAREEGTQIVVEVAGGALSFASTDVESIKKEATKLHEYLEKHRTVKESSNAEDLYSFVLWAESAGITRDRDALLRKVIAVSPDHEGARTRLGYQRHDGKWLTVAELMKAKGFVRHEGRWVTEAEKEMLDGKKREAKLKTEIARLQEEERRRAEREQREEMERRVLQEWWILRQMALSRSSQRAYREASWGYPWWQVYEPYASYGALWGGYHPLNYPVYNSSGTVVWPGGLYTLGTIYSGSTGGSTEGTATPVGGSGRKSLR